MHTAAAAELFVAFVSDSQHPLHMTMFKLEIEKRCTHTHTDTHTADAKNGEAKNAQAHTTNKSAIDRIDVEE